MLQRTYRLLTLITVGLWAATSTAAGTTDSEQRWYRIEVLIFANESVEAGHGERWLPQQGLRYPKTLAHLIDPAPTPLLSNFSTIGDNTDSTPLPETNSNEEQQTVENSASTEVIASESTIEQIAPTPFEKLPAAQLQLTEAAQRLAGTRDLRPLFHQAWLQPLITREQAPAIVISGGQAFDDHFELEGSIKVSVERYLHVHTDLWLSRFMNRTGSDADLWQHLPARPKPETPTILSNGFISENSPFQTPWFQPLLEQNSRYAPSQTAVMRQERRMRSDELHYIDHPLFGMLIIVSNIDWPASEPNDTEPATP